MCAAPLAEWKNDSARGTLSWSRCHFPKPGRSPAELHEQTSKRRMQAASGRAHTSLATRDAQAAPFCLKTDRATVYLPLGKKHLEKAQL